MLKSCNCDAFKYYSGDQSRSHQMRAMPFIVKNPLDYSKRTPIVSKWRSDLSEEATWQRTYDATNSTCWFEPETVWNVHKRNEIKGVNSACNVTDCKKSTRNYATSAKEGNKRIRTIFTTEQLQSLEQQFERQQYMVGSERFVLIINAAQSLEGCI